jgi:hypothetical protein
MSAARKRDYEFNTRGHVWKLTNYNDGQPEEIDVFAYNPSDPHNGPLCANCGYGFCHNCSHGPQQDCSVKVSDALFRSYCTDGGLLDD